MLDGILNGFLTEYILVYISGIITSIQSDSGEVADIPMVVEGVLWDFDEHFLLLGDDKKINLTLISRDKIARIDIVDRASSEMNNPLKPDKGAMC